MKRALAISLVFITLFSALSASPWPFIGSAAEKKPFHYLSENEARYEAYQAKNPRMPYDKVVAYVNADVDIGFYHRITTVSNADSICVMVNKNFALPTGYAPPDLTPITGGVMMRKEAAEQFEKMREEMLRLGYRVHVVVTYRSYSTQTNTYNNAVSRFGTANADVSFARPGHSEHQTGLAIDILHMGGFEYMQHSGFEKTKEFEWLRDNAHRYGFILRYPDGYRDIHGFIFEPWHWRFVGVFIASSMYYGNIALLEEYYGKHLSPRLFENGQSETAYSKGPCW